MKRLIALAFVVLALGAMFVLPASAAQSGPRAGIAQIQPFGGTSVNGVAVLRQLSGGGASIRVTVFGLQPGHQYISLYYGNSTCTNPDFGDQIGGVYTANAAGVGQTRGNADDDLDEVHSVSVRDASTHEKFACGVVNSFPQEPAA